MERNPGQNRKEQECIKSMFEDNKINQKLIVREKEMEERINEKHLKKRKHEEADQAGSKKQNRERAEQKLQSRELRSTRRRQMQENEKETLTDGQACKIVDFFHEDAPEGHQDVEVKGGPVEAANGSVPSATVYICLRMGKVYASVSSRHRCTDLLQPID